MNWSLWRCVLDQRIPDGIADIRRGWTFIDWLDATIVLDTLDYLTPQTETPPRGGR